MVMEYGSWEGREGGRWDVFDLWEDFRFGCLVIGFMNRWDWV